MKRFFILALCIAAQTQAANIFDAVLFDAEDTTEQFAPVGARHNGRDCKKCSKPKCGGCTKR